MTIFTLSKGSIPCFAVNHVDISKVTHSRRPGGAIQADEGDVDRSDLHRSGRGSRDKMESCCLGQLPQRLMRVLAGF